MQAGCRDARYHFWRRLLLANPVDLERGGKRRQCRLFQHTLLWATTAAVAHEQHAFKTIQAAYLDGPAAVDACQRGNRTLKAFQAEPRVAYEQDGLLLLLLRLLLLHVLLPHGWQWRQERLPLPTYLRLHRAAACACRRRRAATQLCRAGAAG